MAYEFTEEQKMFKDTVRRLTKEKIAPWAAAIDHEGKFPKGIEAIAKVKKNINCHFDRREKSFDINTA